MRCDQVRHRLPASAAGEAVLSPAEDLHVARCLRCQAELAQHRRVGSALRALQGRRAVVSPELLAEVMGALDADPVRPAEVPTTRRMGTFLAGLAAAAAAGALGAAVLASRSRRPGGAPRMAG